MGDFIGVMMMFTLGIFIGVTITTFNIDPNKDIDLLSVKCTNNQGIKTILIGINEYRVSCKDGAEFFISR